MLAILKQDKQNLLNQVKQYFLEVRAGEQLPRLGPSRSRGEGREDRWPHREAAAVAGQVEGGREDLRLPQRSQ